MHKQGEHWYFLITLMLEGKDLLKRFSVSCCPPISLSHRQWSEV